MRLTLIYNPTAGSGLDDDDLVELLEVSGHEVRVASRNGDWRTALGWEADALVVAGGDGTVRDVALAAAEHGIPLGVLPWGTANNIGKSLELTGDARDVIAGWGSGRRRAIDLGLARTGTVAAHFVEGVGGGCIAELVAAGKELVEKRTVLLGRETDRALHLVQQVLREAEPQRWEVVVDGSRLDGEYLAVEVMNIRFAGPNLPLAPDADVTDGLLDVVTIGTQDVASVDRYLEQRLTLASGTLPKLPTTRGREIRLKTPYVRFHVDDQLWPSDEVDDGLEVEIRVQPGALDLLGTNESDAS